MNKIDFERINTVSLSCIETLLMSWFPAGKKEGREFRIGDINGSPGSSLSINMNTGLWCDFASGDKGSDLISLYALMNGISQGESAKRIDEMISAGGVSYETKAPSTKKSSDWIALPFAPPGSSKPDLNHYKHGMPAMTWDYFDCNNNHVGVICRFETETGKEVLPITWCRNEKGYEAWRWKSFAKPRPLFNSNLVVSNPTKPILVVEGEKTASSAMRLLPHVIVVTWAGGSKAVDLADWSILENRKIVIWGDNDEPGVRASLAIQSYLPQAKIVQPPHSEEGWDLADAEKDGWTTEQVRSYILQAKQSAPEVRLPLPPVVDTTDYGEVPDMPAPPQAIEEELPSPFRILGHDDGMYFYLPSASQQIVSLSAGEHRHLPLLRLAPANWWEQNFPAKTGADWNAVANHLIERSHREGIFTPRRVRGRGVWIDGDNIIFHCGDGLIVNGKRFSINEFKTNYIYEQGQKLSPESAQPCDNQTSAQLITLCEKLSWKEPIFAKFLAGWCAIAPISGVLHWRPHIWINGPSGTGKTWVINNILNPLVGKYALHVQSATTEAGIRQTLRSDALPIIFDEAEAENQRAQMRMGAILELARQASSETGAGIIKGSATGKAQEYQIRSSFAFASIGVSATLRADTSRITSLELKKLSGEDADTQFRELKEVFKLTMAMPEYAEGIRARSLHLAKVICSNGKTFGTAVATKLGDQRMGDQIGALLAGAYSLTSTKEVDLDFAKKWVEEQNWTGFVVQDDDKDEVRALSTLLDAHIRIESEKGAVTRSISEVVVDALGGVDGYVTGEDKESARSTLLRHGIKVDDDYICISNHHQALKKIFQDTPWADKWKDQMSRVQGAISIAGVKFMGSTHRAVKIPSRIFI